MTSPVPRRLRAPVVSAPLRAAAGSLVLLAMLGLAQPVPALSQEGLAGTLVVVNKGESTLSVIDVASGGILAVLPTGEGPHEVAMTSDGSKAIVTDYAGGNSLTIVDVPGLAVERTVDLSDYPRPHGIAVMPGDEVVAVTSEQSDKVVLVRIGDGRIVGNLPTGHPGSHMLAMVADGSTIHTSNMGDNTVSTIDVASGTQTGTVRVPPRPEAVGVTPDGEEVWVGSNDEGKVSVVHTATGEVETALEGFGWPYRVLFTPDKRLVLLPDLGKHQLRIVDRAARRALAVLDFPEAGPQGITLDATARYAFLSLSQEARLVVIDLQSRQVVRSIDTGPTPDGVAYTTRVVAAR